MDMQYPSRILRDYTWKIYRKVDFDFAKSQPVPSSLGVTRLPSVGSSATFSH